MSWKTPLLQQCVTHRILFVEIWGHALIITPKGDASGFSEAEFKHEQATIESIIPHEQIQAVILDLKNSTYFGNEMTAVLVHLAELCKTAGKVCAFCDVSDAMLVPLRHLRDDASYEWHERRKHAEKKFVHLTAAERGLRFSRQRIVRLLGLLAIFCLLWVWVNFLREKPSELLTIVAALENDMKNHRTMRGRAYSPEYWDEALTRYRDDIERYLKKLDKDTSPPAEKIKEACQLYLLKLYEEPWTASNQQIQWDQKAQQLLAAARTELKPSDDEQIDE